MHRVVNAVITITNPSIFPFIAITMAVGITSGAAARTFTGAITKSSSIAVISNLLHTFIHTYIHTYGFCVAVVFMSISIFSCRPGSSCLQGTVCLRYRHERHHLE